MTLDNTRIKFTVGRISSWSCPPDKSQFFYWDTDSPTLALRISRGGRKTYVCDTRLHGSPIRVAIGTVADWTIPQARERASEFKRLADRGEDPREVKQEQKALQIAASAKRAAESVTVRDAWSRYLVEGRPKRKEAWKPRYLSDMTAMGSAGGEKRKRGEGTTQPGYIYGLLELRLAAVDEDRLAAWFLLNSQQSKHQAARALMMFRGFLRWCAARPEYRKLVHRDAGKAAAIVEAMPAAKRRTDALESAQVQKWWEAVAELPNATHAIYLRTLLLTGARREEVAALRWDDVDFAWKKLTLADKVDATRTIPLTDRLASLLSRLPKAYFSDGSPNPFIFASASETGHIADVRSSHAKVLNRAGITALTIHGLRRSFSLLGEAAGAPAGAIAQVMGHKPSATAEGYRPRSVDALRPFVSQIEAHICCLAGLDSSVLGDG